MGSAGTAVVLRVDARTTTITVGDLAEESVHGGVSAPLLDRVHAMRRAQLRQGQRAGDLTGGHLAALQQLGAQLARDFLSRRQVSVLGQLLDSASEDQPVTLAVDIEAVTSGGMHLDRLPWEAMRVESRDALALIPAVTVVRGPAAVSVQFPDEQLRMVVAIAAPESSELAELDTSREVSAILSALRSPNLRSVDVEVVEFATLETVARAVARVRPHVLHLSAHGLPGAVVFEDSDGGARPCSVEQLAEAAFSTWTPTLVTLAACSSDVPTAASDAGSPLASGLIALGVPVVVAAESGLLERYAVPAFALMYQRLARAGGTVDAAAAAAAARRDAGHHLAGSLVLLDRLAGSLDQWAGVTVRVRSDVPAVQYGAVHAAPDVVSAELQRRPIRQDLVGRRQLLRELPARLLAPNARSVVVSGPPGIGKTALVDAVIEAVYRLDPNARVDRVDETTYTAADDRSNFPLDGAATSGQMPDVLVDTISDSSPTECTERPVESKADRQATNGLRRVALITTREPLEPSDVEVVQLGPLTRPQALVLAWSQPELIDLMPQAFEPLWSTVGGNPGLMIEFARAAGAIINRLVAPDAAALEEVGRTLAITTADAADLNGRLAALDRSTLGLLLRVSVHRRPIGVGDLHAAGQPCAVADVAVLRRIGLLEPRHSAADGDELTVPRWVATALGDRWELQWPLSLRDAHGAAGAAARRRGERIAADPAVTLLEALEHLLAAGQWSAAGSTAHDAALLLATAGRMLEERWVIERALRGLPANYERRAAWFFKLGVNREETGDHHAALEAYLAALELDLRRHDRVGVLGDLTQLGNIASMIDAGDLALRYFHLAAAQSVRAGALLEAAEPLHNAGQVHQERGRLRWAGVYYLASLLLERLKGRRHTGLAASWRQLGSLAQDHGRAATAQRRYQRALQMDRDLGSASGTAADLLQLGGFAYEQDRYNDASDLLHEAIDEFEGLEDADSIAACWFQLALVAEGTGDRAASRERVGRAKDFYVALDADVSTARCVILSARLALLDGDPQPARDLVAHPPEAAAESVHVRLELLWLASRVAARDGDAAAGRRAASAAQRLGAASGLPINRADEDWVRQLSMAPPSSVPRRVLVLRRRLRETRT